jgi:uncharacterized RDD family membrane protein YckC
MSAAYAPPPPAHSYAPPRDPTAVMGRRIVAFLIDYLPTITLFFLLFASFAETTDKPDFFTFNQVDACPTVRAETDRNVCFETDGTVYTITDGEAVIAFGLPFAVSFLNLVLLQGTQSASIGKAVMGLRVIDGGGQIAGVGRALVRWLFLLIDMICLVLGLIVASVTKPHRRLGDFVAGTYVVGKDDVGTALDATRPPAPASLAYAPPPTGYQQYTPYAPPTTPQTYAPTTQPFGTPYPAPPTAQPAPAPPPQPSAPVWDAPRGAWVSFDPARQASLRYDDATKQWLPL